MREGPLYLVDSDVFIAAKNAYYAFDICPGFWDSLVHFGRSGSLRSIDKVQDELRRGNPKEDLVQWTRGSLPAGFFLATDTPDVMAAYEEVMLWVQRNPQYQDQAKAKFATEADGWLVASARVNGTLVVTNEQPRPESRNRVLLPDVCKRFNVPFRGTFAMLRQLQARFHWKPPP